MHETGGTKFQKLNGRKILHGGAPLTHYLFHTRIHIIFPKQIRILVDQARVVMQAFLVMTVFEVIRVLWANQVWTDESK